MTTTSITPTSTATTSSRARPATTPVPSTRQLVPATTSTTTTVLATTVPAVGPAPAVYGEAALDRFGPLEPSPSLVITVGQGNPVPTTFRLVAERVEGGVVVAGSQGPFGEALDRTLPVAAVNHDGTVRWSRSFAPEGWREVLVAAPDQRPANLLVRTEIDADGAVQHRWVQLSLATGAEQSAFASAMGSLGLDAGAVGRLHAGGTNDRYALLVDGDYGPFSTVQRIVRYDLAVDVAVDVPVPPEMQATPGGDPSASWLSLLGSGDVIVEGGGAVVARWHDGTWSRDPATLATGIGVRPTFGGGLGEALHGVDALGQVVWTDPQLTAPSGQVGGIELDGPVAVVAACLLRDERDVCADYQTLGLDPTTGEVRWTLPGVRSVASDPADGYVLLNAGDVLHGAQPGWVLLDDRTGVPVAGQAWDDPVAFSSPCCGESEYNSTTRTGGMVIVVEGEQVRVWYAQGTGGPTRTVPLP